MEFFPRKYDLNFIFESRNWRLEAAVVTLASEIGCGTGPMKPFPCKSSALHRKFHRAMTTATTQALKHPSPTSTDERFQSSLAHDQTAGCDPASAPYNRKVEQS